MWTTISSYIWGEADEQIVPGCAVDDTQSDDDWILVDVHETKFLGKWFLFCRNFHLRLQVCYWKRKWANFKIYFRR